MGVGQPYIGNLILNARTFDRRVVQEWFEDWVAFAQDNTRIWETYYRPKPLFADMASWDVWLPEYRQLVIDMQAIYEEHAACGRVGS